MHYLRLAIWLIICAVVLVFSGFIVVLPVGAALDWLGIRIAAPIYIIAVYGALLWILWQFRPRRTGAV